MAQYGSNATTPGGLIVQTVLSPSESIVTYTVTAPNGTIAIAEVQPNTSSIAVRKILNDQLIANGVDANTASVGLLNAIDATTNSVNLQNDAAIQASAATGNPPPNENTALPVSTVGDPQVPQPNDNQQIAQTSAGPVPLEESLSPGETVVAQSAPGNSDPALYPHGLPYDDDNNLNPGWSLDENNNPVWVGNGFVEPATQAASDSARAEAATKQRAKNQQTLAARRNLNNPGDWRFRIALAPGAEYLYNAKDPGILGPLKGRGVIFPYTPNIEMNYLANYDRYDLIHSNYRGYFYRNSAVNEISVRGTFTAQDTAEAQYLLAVMHFFKSVTKMFYGQDSEAGTPPPLVYVTGFGQYQFNEHACLVSNFGYTLPNDVDYIRTDAPNNIGINLENRSVKSSGPGPGGALGSLLNRLSNNFLTKGALPGVPNPSNILQNTNNTNPNNSTYVPTKMDITLSLLPVQTRSQVSQQFSLKGFANGQLLKGGFW